jgi:hypothetical protein
LVEDSYLSMHFSYLQPITSPTRFVVGRCALDWR